MKRTALAGTCSLLALGMLTAVPIAQARVEISPNYALGTDDLPGRGWDGVSLDVDPANARHIVETNADWLRGTCEHHVSFDGGKTWKGGAFRAPAGFSSLPCTVGPHLAEHTQNGGVAYGSGRRVYATFSSPRLTPAGTETGKSLLFSASVDGGRNWGTPIVIAEGGPDTTQGPNHILPTIGVQRAATGGPKSDRVYIVAATIEAEHEGASAENARVVVSDDGGKTFREPVNINTPAENAIEPSRPVVTKDGSVYVSWRDRGRGEKPGTFVADGFVVSGKSTDQGHTWTQTRTAQVTAYTFPGTTPQPPFSPGQVFSGSTFPRMTADPRNGNLYIVYGQGPQTSVRAVGGAHAADHFINPDQDVYFQRSTDAGATWSVPRRINDAPPLQTEITQTRHPSVSVAADGRIDIVWQDRRNWYRGCTNTHAICSESRLGDTYYAYSKNRGATFSRNFRISDRSTNNDVGFDYRFGTYWAYGPVTVPTGDNRLLVAWEDSRNGNLQNDTQDVYLSEVKLASKAPVPVKPFRHRDAPAFSVALSKAAYIGGPEAVLQSTFASRPFTRVVIVNETDSGSAVAGGVLARANITSVLASPAGGLPAAVKKEVRRLAPIGAYIVGSQSALSPQVATDLAALGIAPEQVVRLNGASPADTAGQVASAMDRRTDAEKAASVPAFNAAIVVNPASPDAVTAATLAADRRLPVLFSGPAGAPAETLDAIKKLGITSTLVVGGPGSVSDAALAGLPSPQRLGGANLYATSAAVLAESRRRGVPDNNVWVTDGTHPMDDALMGSALGRIGAVQLSSKTGAAGALVTIAKSKGLRDSVNQIVEVGR